jgi:hypothetical protein
VSSRPPAARAVRLVTRGLRAVRGWGRVRRALAAAAWLLVSASAVLAAKDIRQDRYAIPAARPVANRAFPSALQPRAPAELWAVGDGAAGTRAARRLAERIVRAHPARLLYLGDVYETGTALEFKRRFARIYAQLLTRTDPTPGNHEWPAHRTGYDPFWRSVTGAPTPPWYAFDIGGWKVLSLNSQTPKDADQLRWLQRQLRSDGHGTCTIAFWHRPRFSAGKHGDQPDLDLLWEAVRGHARLVLSGHDHDLQRLRPITGVTQLVVGAGGRDHYPVHQRDRRLAFSDDRHFGALRLRLAPGHAQLAFISVGGAVLDRSAVRCRP